MRYTPGPWKLELINKWPFGVRVVAQNDYTILRQDAYCNSSVQKTRKDCEEGVGFSWTAKRENETTREQAANCIAEQDANARLVTAAPKMLKELKDILDWALVEKTPLRDVEIESIRRLIAEATVAG